MFNVTHYVRRALLALALVATSGAALAGPSYQVTIHTQAYSGESGLLDFGFGSNADAPLGIATLWNFSGAFGAEYDRSGSVVGDLAGGVEIATGNLSTYLTEQVILGGDFMFNIRFSGDYDMVNSPDGASFLVALYDADLQNTLGNVVQFDLIPAFNGAPAGVDVTVNDELASVGPIPVDVPEPSQLLLALSALAAAGLVRRRARSNG